MNVKITPYHLFCIIKQYGENIELFHPDIKKQNDYYFIANGIIYSDIELISFTMSTYVSWHLSITMIAYAQRKKRKALNLGKVKK